MSGWYSRSRDIELKDGHKSKEYHLVFETTDKDSAKLVEKFFKELMDKEDGKDGNDGKIE